MLQISWLRIMETMEVVMVWALLLLIRVVESHVYFLSSKPAPKIFAIGRYIYIYMLLSYASCKGWENLSARSFQSLAEAMPKDD